MISPAKIPDKAETESEEAKISEAKRLSEVLEIPGAGEEFMNENELFSNLDIAASDDFDKRESFGRLTEQINENN